MISFSQEPAVEGGGRGHAEAAQILPVRCPAEQFFRGGGGKFHLAVCHLPADPGAGTGARLSAAGAQEPQLCPDAGGKVFLSEEPDPDGGL